MAAPMIDLAAGICGIRAKEASRKLLNVFGRTNRQDAKAAKIPHKPSSWRPWRLGGLFSFIDPTVGEFVRKIPVSTRGPGCCWHWSRTKRRRAWPLLEGGHEQTNAAGARGASAT